jgi:hypothetical protein
MKQQKTNDHAEFEMKTIIISLDKKSYRNFFIRRLKKLGVDDAGLETLNINELKVMELFHLFVAKTDVEILEYLRFCQECILEEEYEDEDEETE